MIESTLRFNADLGEGCGQDAALMPWLDQANIACGEHAGDEGTMCAAVELALEHGLEIGAHPGYADRAHFGRRAMHLGEKTLRTLLLRQLERLDGCVRRLGGRLRYVKLHGALYNQAVAERELAAQVVEILRTFDPGLACMTLPVGELARQARAAGLTVIREGFADRRHDARGWLVPRHRPDAFIHDPEEAAAQARRLVREMNVSSLCVHGDNVRALEFVRLLRQRLCAH